MKGLLINYAYCTGCHSCEVSCQMENHLPEDRFGIKIQKVGPWEIDTDVWQYDFIPVPTDQCNLCAGRVDKGKDPLCVHHCQAAVMEYGEIADLAKRMEQLGSKTVLFMPKASI